MIWETWQKARAFRKLPHEIVEHEMLADPLLRYYFNRGVYTFGRHVEAELDAAEKRATKASGRRNKQPNERLIKQARLNALTRCLDLQEEKKRYRDPGKVDKAEFSA